MPRLLPRARGLRRVAALTVAVSLGAVSTAAAHDHWLIPDLFAFGANATLHINARQGTRFQRDALSNRRAWWMPG